MERSKKMVLVAHCLLNVNAKVEGIAVYPAASRIISELIGQGYGIIQLPCIEQAMMGIGRWGIVHEQCSYPAFQRKCRELLTPIVEQVEDFVRNGYEVKAVIGLDGSPTCGVNLRAAGNWRGEVDYKYGLDEKVSSAHLEEGPGTMMEILMQMFGERGLAIPFCAIDESNDDMELGALITTVLQNG